MIRLVEDRGREEQIYWVFVLLAFLIIYWGVRFIKNNISFLKEYNNNDE
jgi:hypothetical protein